MIFKPGPLIFILAFALLIQNTCPFGAAGKSSVAAMCGNCCLHHHLIVSSDGQRNLASEDSLSHFPLYVFAVPKTIHTFKLYPVKSVQSALADHYVNISPHELLRPPRA
jgi:hypothetical protein